MTLCGRALCPFADLPICWAHQNARPVPSASRCFFGACLADLDQGARAAGADVHAASHVPDGDLLDVDVRLEDAVRARRLALPPTGVLVTDVSAEGRAFAAEVAFRSHSRSTVTDAAAPDKPVRDR